MEGCLTFSKLRPARTSQGRGKIEINVTAANTNAVIGNAARAGRHSDDRGSVLIRARRIQRVVVDCENYRENRELTRKSCQQAGGKGDPFRKKLKLEPMNVREADHSRRSFGQET
ncbi:MAG: hypothetical protein ACLS4Z_02960 [Christensenellaceae bacterium]